MSSQPTGIRFRATIPPIQSALKFGGDAPRITFEVPKSDRIAAGALIELQGVGLKITVEVDDGNDNSEEGDNQETGKGSRKARSNSVKERGWP